MHERVVRIGDQPYDVFIARPSKWGNPFSPQEVGGRRIAIEMYENWLREQPELMASLWELKGKVLGCHCAPSPCHGEVLVRLSDIAWERRQRGV
jgi:hypothetical protein